MSEPKRYTKGSLIEFSSGEYSDYRTIGFLVMIQDVDMVKLAHEYQREFKPAYDGQSPNTDSFPNWLVAKQYALPVDYSGVYLGSYGFDPEFAVPQEDDAS